MPSEAAGLTNPAGGLRYHIKALRYGERLWSPFRWSLGEWLLDWHPPERTLLLVGPSGGYNLQPFVLERFERVVVLEPDPIARWLLSRRLRKVPLEPRPTLEFIARDHLVHHPERLADLLSSLGRCAVLFTNVLGQVRHLLEVEEAETPEFAKVRSAVRGALVGRSWASFHDRVSGRVAPTIEEPVLSEHRLSDDELLDSAYYEGASPIKAMLFDHATEGFFPEALPHLYLRWEIEPGVFHVIEAVADVHEG
jgi:hypothetical protein